MTALPLFGPVPGGTEMVVVLLVAVLLFGANKIPKLAHAAGASTSEFRKGRQKTQDERSQEN